MEQHQQHQHIMDLRDNMRDNHPPFISLRLYIYEFRKNAKSNSANCLVLLVSPKEVGIGVRWKNGRGLFASDHSRWRKGSGYGNMEVGHKRVHVGI